MILVPLQVSLFVMISSVKQSVIQIVHTALKGGMNIERWIVKDVEGSSHYLIWGTYDRGIFLEELKKTT
jgi:hypothetical protein